MLQSIRIKRNFIAMHIDAQVDRGFGFVDDFMYN